MIINEFTINLIVVNLIIEEAEKKTKQQREQKLRTKILS